MIDRHNHFQDKIAALGAKVDLVQTGPDLAGASASDPSRAYAVTQDGPDKWRAIAFKGGEGEEIFQGASRDEAALACLCREAAELGIPQMDFRSQRTSVVLRNAQFLAKGSIYENREAGRIEVASDPARRFLTFDRDGHPIRPFSDARLAMAYLSVLADWERQPVDKAAPAPRERIVPEALSFDLILTKRPTLAVIANGAAYMVVEGVEQTQDGPRDRKVVVSGDRARAVHAVLQGRPLNEENPTRMSVETILRPRRQVNAANGAENPGWYLEATKTQIHPREMKRAPVEIEAA